MTDCRSTERSPTRDPTGNPSAHVQTHEAPSTPHLVFKWRKVAPHFLSSLRKLFVFHHRCAEKRYPEDLPTISVVLIYLDEALSVIKRAIRSIIDRTPARLLKEIILVDDHSSNGRILVLKHMMTNYLVIYEA